MKDVCKPIIIGFCFLLMLSCTDMIEQHSFEEIASLKSVPIPDNRIMVAPSGDLSGVTDADHIEAALEAAKSTGETVYLSDGDDNTIDHFYTSRNIIVEGFKGTLAGESPDHTIIHAGRKSATEGFEGAISPWWSQLSGNSFLTTVLQLDTPLGAVIIQDFSIVITDDQPTDIQPDFYGNDATYISTFIEILGGEHDTFIENIRLEGKETSAFGNVNGMNVDIGIHVMLGSPVTGIVEKGILSIKKVEIENTGNGAILFMRFGSGSMVSVQEARANNVGQGINAGGLFDSSVDISNNEFSTHDLGYQGIALWNIPSGLRIADNTIRESRFAGIALWEGVNRATITNNKFIDLMKKFNFAAIISRGMGNTFKQNDYKESDLPGWSNETAGPGALVLTAATSGNFVQESKFPPGMGVTLCEMIMDLTDDVETPGYDGLNEIHNYQACENIAGRDLRFEELAGGVVLGNQYHR